jgi:hypothetical protein
LQTTLIKPKFDAAIFSKDRKYRYTLYREWRSDLPVLMLIGLNPSTADEIQNDPTIRRCIDFAKSWGFGRIIMTNLFAIRGTDPKILKEVVDPIGMENDSYLVEMAQKTQLVIGAWGTLGTFMKRSAAVKALIPNIKCLGVTQNHQPKHPLYLKKDTPFIDWNNAE